ncbi:MAG: prepilin-type N-terminal cleavage/methylation domain-containing protein [Kiritimatiellae bacterium]|nr:prepilin-type N-terminal cleavage/methylation domain-containing protein [Kiritimatiellia bacterium]
MEKNSRGFTLIELMVVIGILGILMSVLVTKLSGGTDAARAVKCLGNMTSLARAVHQYAAATTTSTGGSYPTAGSRETYSGGTGGGSIEIYEHPGWINWFNPSPAYPVEKIDTDSNMSRFRGRKGGSSISGYGDAGSTGSAYEAPGTKYENSKRKYCIEMGGLWDFVNHNASVYVCPCHPISRYFKSQTRGKLEPLWSYAMNAYFGWQESKNDIIGGGNNTGVAYGENDFTGRRAAQILLFAEIQWEDAIEGIEPRFNSGCDTSSDGILQFKDSSAGGYNETIGVNHKSGRDLTAHVVFLDGHAEKISFPMKPGSKQPYISASELQELTKWYCQGTTVQYDATSHKFTKIER